RVRRRPQGAANGDAARAGEVTVEADRAALAAWHVGPHAAVEGVGDERARDPDVLARAERPGEGSLRKIPGADGIAGHRDLDGRPAIRAARRCRHDDRGLAGAAHTALARSAGVPTGPAVVSVVVPADAGVVALRKSRWAPRAALAARADERAGAGRAAASAVRRVGHRVDAVPAAQRLVRRARRLNGAGCVRHAG